MQKKARCADELAPKETGAHSIICNAFVILFLCPFYPSTKAFAHYSFIETRILGQRSQHALDKSERITCDRLALMLDKSVSKQIHADF